MTTLTAFCETLNGVFASSGPKDDGKSPAVSTTVTTEEDTKSTASDKPGSDAESKSIRSCSRKATCTKEGAYTVDLSDDEDDGNAQSKPPAVETETKPKEDKKPKPPFALGTKISKIFENPDFDAEKEDGTAEFAIWSGVLEKYEELEDKKGFHYLVKYEDGDTEHLKVADVGKLQRQAETIEDRLMELNKPLPEPPIELGTTLQRISWDDDTSKYVVVEGTLKSYEKVMTDCGPELCFMVKFKDADDDEHFSENQVKYRLRLAETGELQKMLDRSNGNEPKIVAIAKKTKVNTDGKELDTDTSDADIEDEDSDDDLSADEGIIIEDADTSSNKRKRDYAEESSDDDSEDESDSSEDVQEEIV